MTIDLWTTAWIQHRGIRQIRADSVTALTAWVYMRPMTAAHGIIIRELAMRLDERSYLQTLTPLPALHTS